MRPRIICHMVSSIDGRLLVDRWTPPARGIEKGTLSQRYEEIAAQFGAGGWMVGRKTMTYYANGTPRPSTTTAAFPRETFCADGRGRDIAVAIDPHGKLHYGTDQADGNHLVTILGEQVSDTYLAELREDNVSYLFAGPDGHDLHRAMDILGDSFGIKTILLEGGGIINGAFLKAWLIDEISLLVYPGIDGLAGMPSIFEYEGTPDDRPATGLSLRHTSTDTLDGGMVWLRYGVEKSPTPTAP